ncbi:MAG TPA: TadE family protein [Phototrophicaceae bacterium]|nr:TadE family protein [Phototrophicaceae bacterium]
MRKFLQKIVQILDGTPANYGKNRQRGQSLVELAFITPILVIMVAGIVEIGWYANNYISLLEAAKVGARRGPFLNGDNAPQLFPDDASIAPNDYGSSGYIGLPPHPLDATAAQDPRYRMRGLTFPYRENQCGEGIDPQRDIGFYNIIACTVLDSLDPLVIRTGLNERSGKQFRDDIVVSVFAVQSVNNCPEGQTNPGDPKPETNKCDMDINQGNTTHYEPGHQIIVVGRYPSNANECASGGDTVERDPFDYITNGGFVNEKIITTPTGDVRLPLELGIPIYDSIGGIIGYDPFADPVVGFDTWVDERQRGWAWTGQHKLDPIDGYTGGDCYGSDFTSAQVQELMNLPQFVETDKASAQDRLSYLPSQGLVLVEVFWEHDLLMGEAFPLFYGAYNLFTNLTPESGGNLIRVWSAFPAAAAEPHIIYTVDN